MAAADRNARTAPESNENARMNELIGRDVYTRTGTYLGEVEDISLNFNEQEVCGLALNGYTVNNDALPLSRNRGVLIPYKWVTDVDDIIVTIDLPRLIDQNKKLDR